MDESAATNDVMTEALPAGVRRMPTPYDLGLTPSAGWLSDHNALGLKSPVVATGVVPVVTADGRASLSFLDDWFASEAGTTGTFGLPVGAQAAVVAFESSPTTSAAAEKQTLPPNGASMTHLGRVAGEIMDNGALTSLGTDPLEVNRLDDPARGVVG
jgi:hypothetical protein